VLDQLLDAQAAGRPSWPLTQGRLLLRLIEPSSGAVYFQDRNIFELGGKDMRALRARISDPLLV